MDWKTLISILLFILAAVIGISFVVIRRIMRRRWRYFENALKREVFAIRNHI